MGNFIVEPARTDARFGCLTAPESAQILEVKSVGVKGGGYLDFLIRIARAETGPTPWYIDSQPDADQYGELYEARGPGSFFAWDTQDAAANLAKNGVMLSRRGLAVVLMPMPEIRRWTIASIPVVRLGMEEAAKQDKSGIPADVALPALLSQVNLRAQPQ